MLPRWPCCVRDDRRGPQDEYFSDGMTDEIITQLAQIRELKVISVRRSWRSRAAT